MYQIPKIRFDLIRGSRGATRRMPSKPIEGAPPIAGLPPIAGHLIASAEIKIKKIILSRFFSKNKISSFQRNILSRKKTFS